MFIWLRVWCVLEFDLHSMFMWCVFGVYSVLMWLLAEVYLIFSLIYVLCAWNAFYLYLMCIWCVSECCLFLFDCCLIVIWCLCVLFDVHGDAHLMFGWVYGWGLLDVNWICVCCVVGAYLMFIWCAVDAHVL